MRLVVTADPRLARTPDGAVWTAGTFHHRFWTRYLSTFEEVLVLGRSLAVDVPPSGARRVDGDGVEVCALPYYHGPLRYMRKLRALRRAVRGAVRVDDAVLARVPCPIAAMLCDVLDEREQPYAVEVVADPYDIFAPGAVRHPLRPVFRRWLTARTRGQCQRAVGAAYVTGASLQCRYPARPGAFTASYSSVELSDEAFVPVPRAVGIRRTSFPTIVSVGSLEQSYKGVDILIGAVARLRARQPAVHLVVIGDGRCRPALEALAARVGLAGAVRFAGFVSAGAQVRHHLDAADLFVLPSRAEGLPKAVLEAMARGLPCVGSTVGGMPELLPPEDLVPPGDADALATRLEEVLRDEHRMVAMSARNLDRARRYAVERLRPRRDAFYRAVRDAVAESRHTPMRWSPPRING